MRVTRWACALAVMLTTVLMMGAMAAQSAAKKPTVAAPAKTAEKSPGAGPIVVVETEKGTFEFETYPNEAPQTVKLILGLVAKRFYNGQRVHRAEPKFVIQIGDPQTRDMTKQDDWGRAESGKTIGVAEFSKLRTHTRGAVAMAHRGDARTADSQFYVTLANHHELDGKYVVFGKVISGMDVVDKLQVTDRIIRVTVKEAS